MPYDFGQLNVQPVSEFEREDIIRVDISQAGK
jgi:hypothetical protein